MTNKIIGYVRVSTEEQVNDGYSVQMQKDKITQYCSLYDIELVDIVSDLGLSAKSLDRPGLKTILSRVGGDISGIIVYKLDRLTRKITDLGYLIDTYFNKYTLLSVEEKIDTNTANGRFTINILMSVSQWEREIISERTKTTLNNMKANGLRVGSIPYGKRLAEDGKSLIDNEDELVIINMVKRMHDQGMKLSSIARCLSEQGYINRMCTKWHVQTIKNILKY